MFAENFVVGRGMFAKHLHDRWTELIVCQHRSEGRVQNLPSRRDKPPLAAHIPPALEVNLFDLRRVQSARRRG